MQKTTSVYLKRKFNCSKIELFKWIVDPALISKWFGPKHLKATSVKSNPANKGEYEIVLSKQSGESFTIKGNYLEVDEPNKIVLSFRYTGLNNPPPDSTVKITLEKIDSTTTELMLIQKFDLLPSDMENRSKAWEYMFLKLSEIIRL